MPANTQPIFSIKTTDEIKDYLPSKGVSDDTIKNLSNGQLLIKIKYL